MFQDFWLRLRHCQQQRCDRVVRGVGGGWSLLPGSGGRAGFAVGWWKLLILVRKMLLIILAASPPRCFIVRRVKGKPVDEVLSIKNSDIAKHLSLPPVKLHCSMLAEDAIKAAVKDWRAKQKPATEADAPRSQAASA